MLQSLPYSRCGLTSDRVIGVIEGIGLEIGLMGDVEAAVSVEIFGAADSYVKDNMSSA